jgi:hypothetical protein
MRPDRQTAGRHSGRYSWLASPIASLCLIILPSQELAVGSSPDLGTVFLSGGGASWGAVRALVTRYSIAPSPAHRSPSVWSGFSLRIGPSTGVHSFQDLCCGDAGQAAKFADDLGVGGGVAGQRGQQPPPHFRVVLIRGHVVLRPLQGVVRTLVARDSVDWDAPIWSTCILARPARVSL